MTSRERTIREVLAVALYGDKSTLEWDAPRQAFDALEREGWLRPERAVPVVNVDVVPLTERMGGMYRVSINDQPSAYFFDLRHADAYADTMKRGGK